MSVNLLHYDRRIGVWIKVKTLGRDDDIVLSRMREINSEAIVLEYMILIVNLYHELHSVNINLKEKETENLWRM